MLKKISLLMIAFIISIALLTLLNDNVEKEQLFEETLYTTSSIDAELDLVIHSEYNETIDYSMDDEQLNDIFKDRIKIVESSDLTNTIKIYTYNIHNEVTKVSVVTIEDNVISITSELGPIVEFTNPTFLSYFQFDYSFFKTIPRDYFVIYIPEGMEYTLD